MSLEEVAGGPSPAAIAETRTAAKEAEGVSNKYAVVDGSDQASNEFPYVPFAPDNYDDTAAIKVTFGDPRIIGGDNWQVPLEADDIDYLKRQRDQVENADFDRWIMQKYDLTNPAQMKLFQDIAPDQYQRRMDLIDYEQNLVTNYAKTRLEGPKTMEELKFQWLVETGRIELPQAPLWDPVQWMGAQMNQTKIPLHNRHWALRALPNFQRFQAGMFSPLTFINSRNPGNRRNPDNPADIVGKGKAEGQIVNGADRHNTDIYRQYGTNPIWTSVPQRYRANLPGEYFGHDFNRPRHDRIPADIRAGKGYGFNPVRMP